MFSYVPVWLYDKVRRSSKPCEFALLLLDFSAEKHRVLLFGFVAPFLLPYGRRISAHIFLPPVRGNLYEEKG